MFKVDVGISRIQSVIKDTDIASNKVKINGIASAVVNDDFFEFEFKTYVHLSESIDMLNMHVESEALRIYHIKNKLSRETVSEFLKR